ncbi:MAG: HAMP domain-containing sensor histidine kinase [bacterium]
MERTIKKPTEASRFRDLLGQVQLINRVHAALSSTIQIDDIYSIILSTLLSRSGLGFSRSFLFTYDDREDLFRGHMALGVTSKEDWETLNREMLDESAKLREMLEAQGKGETGKDETLFLKQNISDLLSTSHWIVNFQRLGLDSDLTENIKSIQHAPDPGEAGSNPLQRVAEASGVVHFKKSKAMTEPPQFLDLLGDEFLGLPLRTKKGVRALVFTDKKFAEAKITERDRMQLEWFSSQCNLALENADLFRDLEHAYNELKELENLKNSFLSTVSHELRTPLTAIIGFTQLLIDGRVGSISSNQRELLDRVHRHSQRLISMVNDLLEIAEIESSESMRPELSPVDPLLALMNTLPRLEQRRATKDVVIEPIVKGRIPNIRAEERALERIYFHLLDNAIKFIPRKGRIEVLFEQSDGLLTISIADNGIGISPDHLKKIFDSFYQVDSTLSRGYEGMGIGLTVTKKLVQSLGGRVDVKSTLGKGSTFSATFTIA